MMHNLIVGAVFVAMVLSPCVIAMFSAVKNPDTASEPDIREDGFI